MTLSGYIPWYDEFEEDSYVKTKEKMWITHRLCGHRFQQTPHNHLRGQGCPKCCYKNRKNNYSFIEEAKKRFGDRYMFPYIDKKASSLSELKG